MAKVHSIEGLEDVNLFTSQEIFQGTPSSPTPQSPALFIKNNFKKALN
jgi:hypothetical protein